MKNSQNDRFSELFGTFHFLAKKLPAILWRDCPILFRAAGRGLGPCSGCPSCPLFRSPSGRGFFVFSLTEGAGFVASRVAWISGSEPPPDLSLWSFAYFVGSAGFPAWLPCPFRKLSVSYFYTAGLGGDPLLLCEDGALTFRIRGGILVSWRIPCARGSVSFSP